MGGIFSFSVAAPFLQQLLYKSFFAGAAKGLNGVFGNWYDPGGGAFDDPLDSRVRADVELFPNYGWDGNLAALGHLRTHE